MSDSTALSQKETLSYFWQHIIAKLNETTYELPVATASKLGGVKIGSGITLAADGTISVSSSTYSLPTASSSVLGGVKVGNGLSISTSGALSVSTGNKITIDSNGAVALQSMSFSDLNASNISIPSNSITANVFSGNGIRYSST